MQGRAVFETHCAPCHSVSGRGGYFAPDMRPPANAGLEIAKIVRHVRHGGKEMPVFPEAVLPDADLNAVALYVHETLAHPDEQPAPLLGPRELDPFLVGLFTWGALAAFTCLLALLFAEGRN